MGMDTRLHSMDQVFGTFFDSIVCKYFMKGVLPIAPLSTSAILLCLCLWRLLLVSSSYTIIALDLCRHP
jgi:hypothetical protein